MSASCPPILLVFFNRPDVLRKNIQALSHIAPRQLFLAGDGQRQGVPTDRRLIEECRCIAEQIVDWDCNVETLFADCNYGCDDWVPKAITWFFSKVESGIILEDDCIIDDGFVRFASELLEKYKDEHRVMNISAANFQDRVWGDGDYYFSLYPANWGWASWARAWRVYDGHLERIERFMKEPGGLTSLITDSEQRRYWTRFYKMLLKGKYTFWDAKWLLSMWCSKGVSITPNGNLVRNIGFGVDATHTKDMSDGVQLEIEDIGDVIAHPFQGLEVCAGADRYLFESRYRPKLSARVRSLMARMLGR